MNPWIGLTDSRKREGVNPCIRPYTHMCIRGREALQQALLVHEHEGALTSAVALTDLRAGGGVNLFIKTTDLHDQ